MKTNKQQNEMPATKKMVVIRGKGTDHEVRIETKVVLYWSASLHRYVSVPE